MAAVAMMTMDPIDLLVLWWRAEKEWLPVRSYPRHAASARDWRASCQFDDANGAQETDALGELIVHVAHVVEQLDNPWRTALHLLARNRACGQTSWDSPLLPSEPVARAQIVAEALNRFTHNL
jgi:hypothetical protein